MFKKSLLFLLLFALMAPWAANAQSGPYEVQIGEGTSTSGYFPFYTLYKYSIGESLFLASELTDAGVLPGQVTSLSWYATNETGYEQQGISIWLANVTDEALTTTSHVTTDMTLVYTGSVTPVTGWNEFMCGENTFTWDGTSNILIFCQRNNGAWNSTVNWQATTGVGFNAMSYRYQDSGAYDVTVPNPMYTSTTRPNIIIKGVGGGGGVTCDKPETLETELLTESEAMISWEGGSGNYNVQYKVASADEWEVIGENVTYTTFHFTTLQPATTYNFRVQSVCEGDAISGWKTINFTTACGAITNFPWTETFESYNAGEFNDPCWINERIQDGEGSGTLSVFKVSTSSMGGNNTHQLQLPDMAGGTLTKLVLPEMTLPANYEFSIDIYRSSNTYQSNPYELEGIRVYASTDGNIEGATELAFIPRHFEVSNAVIPAESATGWYTYELPIGISGTCYIILRGESQYCTATYMDNFAVKPLPTCAKPTGLAVTANSVTAHNATVTWTENGEASTWIVEYATDADFTDVLSETVEDTPSYTFQRLEPETTYYVRVKAQCDPNDESESSNVVHFTTSIACPAPTGLTVNPGNYSATVNWNGTSESYIVSYRTAAYAEGIVEEFNNFGVPSGWTRYTGLVDYVLTDSIQLQTATSGWGSNTYALGTYNMKLNIFGASCKYWLVTPEFNLSQNLSFDLALTDYGNADPIENDTLQADDRFIVLIYANDAWHILREWNNSGSEYVYNAISATGENVSIDLSAYYGQDVKIAFYGESTVSNNGDNDLHIDNVICGIPYEAGEWQTITVSDTTATITGLNSLTAYDARVLSDCGELDSLSLWTPVITFTTLEDCPVPQNVEVNDITYNSATVTWDGYNDSYNVSYRMAAYVDGVIENFDISGLPAGWTRYSGLVDNVIAGEATLTSISGYWNTTSNALGQYNMKLNIYGTTIHHWLVTPEFRLSQDLSFDLALTDYNNSDPIENDTLQADDRFIVLVYADNAWHILREWNNSGSEYVYNAISAEGEHATIDLSAYYGKKVQIAFYGESTENGGDNDLHIDNIVCGTPVEAGEWETVEATESPVVLTGLTPETPYEVKVQGICGDTETEWSEVLTFTTLEAPATVTQTFELVSGWNWFSTYIEMNPIALLEAIETQLGENGIQIVSKGKVTSYDPDEEEWGGGLQEIGITNGNTYMIEIDTTVTSITVTLEGPASTPDSYSVTINYGWTWIGFPCAEQVDINVALAGFEAAPDDEIVSKGKTSSYDADEEEWGGSLLFLKPGEGYMYNSHSTTPKTLTFQTGTTKK